MKVHDETCLGFPRNQSGKGKTFTLLLAGERGRCGVNRPRQMFVLAIIALLNHGWSQIPEASLYYPAFNALDLGQMRFKDFLFQRPVAEPDHAPDDEETWFSTIVDIFFTDESLSPAEVCIPKDGARTSPLIFMKEIQIVFRTVTQLFVIVVGW